MLYKLDLHIHTKASKCFKADDLYNEGVNRAIIRQAKNKGLDLIAITDHYTIKNYAEISKLAKDENIKVIPGIELSIKTNSAEKLSLIVLFSEEINVGSTENKLLSELEVSYEAQGNGRFLIDKKLPGIVNILNKYNGLIISAHQDKNESRRAFIPMLVKNGIQMFDLRYPDKKEEFMEKYRRFNVIPLTFSDCHEVNNAGKYYMNMPLRECSFLGFKNYINKK